MAQSVSGEPHVKFGLMLNRLNGLFVSGVQSVPAVEPEYGITNYVLTVRHPEDVRRALEIIINSGLMMRDAVDYIISYMSDTDSIGFNWNYGLWNESLI